MDYQHSREQSGEILRLAVSHMGKQTAGYYPASYTLWYEYAAGVNPELSRELTAIVSSGTALTDADVQRLHEQHIASRTRRPLEALQQRLSGLLREACAAVGETGRHTQLFGEQLHHHSMELEQADSADSLFQIVRDLIDETRQMQDANTKLGQQLESRAQEVTQLTDRLELLQLEVHKDPLTGLLNRRGFEQAVERLLRDKGSLEQAALLAIDVDHFKQINDTHGHVAGDYVLRAVAQILRARIRGSDIAVRLGGDEFAVLLPQITLERAKAVAEEIRTTLVKSRVRAADRLSTIEQLTLSFGVAHAGADTSLTELLQRADLALYASKRRGRNRVTADLDSDTAFD